MLFRITSDGHAVRYRGCAPLNRRNLHSPNKRVEGFGRSGASVHALAQLDHGRSITQENLDSGGNCIGPGTWDRVSSNPPCLGNGPGR